MIGHYLLSLTPAQEERVLTGRMQRCGAGGHRGEPRCLVQTVADMNSLANCATHFWTHGSVDLTLCYDALCMRFGESRINAAIRARILANQARRALMRPGVTRVMQPV